MKKLLVILFALMSISCLINNIYYLCQGFKDIESLVWGFVFVVVFAATAVIILIWDWEKVLNFIEKLLDKKERGE